MQKIISNLWFDDQAQEAAKFYTSVFSSNPTARKKSKIGSITRYPKAAEEVSGKSAGSVMTVEFELEGQPFLALNGGSDFKFSEAISFIIECKDQKEIDYFWEKLTEGGEESVCGWLKDKYGLSWQVVPEGMDKILSDPAKSEKAMSTFLQMKKIIIADLEKVYE